MKYAIKSFFGSSKGTRPRRNRSGAARQSTFKPHMEGLEDRALLTAISVFNTDDSGPGSLRAAIALANSDVAADEITFAEGVRGTIKLTSGELSIVNDVIIDGPSFGQITISGNDVSRIFNISGDQTDVAIDDLTLVNGYAEDAGGAILHTGQTLSVTNVEFRHNQVIGNEAIIQEHGGAAGGAIAIFSHVEGGNDIPKATITHSRFTHNKVIGSSGGAYGGAFGGAINNQGHLTITGSTLTHNGVFGGDDNDNQDYPNAFVGLAFGGAINNNFGGKFIMDDCVVTHNQAVAGDRNTGGATAYVGDAGGGGIENIFQSTGAIRNSTIAHNTVVGGNDATTEGNIGGGHAGGGGINNLFFATLTVQNSAITHNRVVGGDRSSLGDGTGGGIHNATLSTLTVENSDIMYNSVTGGQDAIGADAGNAHGGGIQNYLLSTLKLENSRLTNNRATGGLRADGNGASANGGGLSNFLFASATIIDSIFSNNQVVGGQGVVGGNGQGGGIANILATLTFEGGNSEIIGNQARGGVGTSDAGQGLGGGIFNAGSVDAGSVPDVFANHASDEGDDLFGLTLP